ncbi:hypothetical protein PPACK8108_LOCUS4050 [Phakopsora pachyrhizi]|uniref:PCI domain-containing protein n=1 Tax=Phakopsora pachyrhizi TaxID=170000 RepID=A0AAV0AL50_PHAPC|nr:hypothetical protein PPACK8108_LOCUS4050 [Phakopsora pachyrhizi]
MSLDSLLNSLSDGLTSPDPLALAQLIRPLDRSFITQIKPITFVSRIIVIFTIDCIVKSYSLESIESLAQRKPALKNDRTLFDFVTSYLNYIRLVRLTVGENDLPRGSRVLEKSSDDGIHHDNNFDLLLNVYNPASNIFRRADAVYFTQSIQVISHALVYFAITADRSKKSNKNEKASQAARQMTATLGVSCIDRSTEEPSKRLAAFSLANGLFKIYFFLNNMRLCDTVVKNTSNVIHLLETHYPKSQLVTFYYYLGRLALYQRRLHKARESLKRSFDLCKSDSWKNRRLVLIYLIAASLPLGILPDPILLQKFSLVDQFGSIVNSLRTGSWSGVKSGLDNHREWFRFKGIYLLLREKLEVICWRNFFVIMAGLKNGRQGVRLRLANSVEPARKVFMEPSIDEDDIVCMASSLIDQGYLKAYVKFGEVIVFGTVLPRISTVGEHNYETAPTVSSRPLVAPVMSNQSSKSNHGAVSSNEDDESGRNRNSNRKHKINQKNKPGIMHGAKKAKFLGRLG